MPIPVRKLNERNLAVGRGLDDKQESLLESHSPTADDILDNMENLNEEIVESHSEFVENTPKKEKPVPSPVARPTQRNTPRAVQAERRLAEEMPTPEPVVESRGDFDIDDIGKPEQEEVFMSDKEREDRILEYLKKIPNAPSQAQIKAWKNEVGEDGVNLIVFDEKNVFIYTYLKTGQFRKLQEKAQELAAKGDKNAEDMLKEKTVQYCTLWPKLTTEFFYTARAGILESLYNAIWTESYFLSPQQVQMLTVQL